MSFDMAVNLDKIDRWDADIAASVHMYNEWFKTVAPPVFQKTRKATVVAVANAMKITRHLTDVSPAVFKMDPSIIATMRMCTSPPLAVDRLIGLSGCSPRVVKCMEDDGVLPARMNRLELENELVKIGTLIEQMADPDIFTWLKTRQQPTEEETKSAATIVADRLCSAKANPIIRNAQEQRQLKLIKDWLEPRGYRQIAMGDTTRFDMMEPGTFSFRMNVPVRLEGKNKSVNIPLDAVIKPLASVKGDLPIFIEAKSAGDFTNTNKRRKEEAVKMTQLRKNYGDDVQFNLFLCGYFGTGYLEYEAAEGIDWVWEHRVDDMAGFGL